MIRYIIVTDGPLIGPFDSELEAKQWAANNQIPVKWCEELVDPSTCEQGTDHVTH